MPRPTKSDAASTARGRRGGYNRRMTPITRKTLDFADRKPEGGATRSPDAPLDMGSAQSFEDVEPEGFRDDARWSLQAAVSDPDMDDTIGGE